MKKNLTISYDADKLSALTMYLAQKNLSLEAEVEKSLDALFQKTVPQSVRDFIAMRETQNAPAPRATARGRTQTE